MPRRRQRFLHVRCPETPAEWASLMLGVLTSNASDITTQLELLIDKSRDHNVRNELLHVLHDTLALRDYAGGCIERLAEFAELKKGSAG